MDSLSKLKNVLAGKNVFLTGHTGFKGSWLTCWLAYYGCHITGYALAPETKPNLFTLSDVQKKLAGHHKGDITCSSQLTEAMQKAEPELVIHLAAQPLVRRSYQQPACTWSTNVMGTVNLLDAVRTCPTVKAVLVITTDKCYENHEWVWGYREQDPLGGHDPYSASKAATELVVQSYRKSFFLDGGPHIATARGGNVIGGGDWSEDRLFPDIARTVHSKHSVVVRNPKSTRPWQHVLDCLYGYLLLAAYLLEGKNITETAFNFGPSIKDNLAVEALLLKLQAYWPELSWHIDEKKVTSEIHEAHYLYLDSSLARQVLGWSPRWELSTALQKTAVWYRTVFANPEQAQVLTEKQLNEYLNL